MGTNVEKPDVRSGLSTDTDTALLGLYLDIVSPRTRYLELATFLDQEHFAEGGCRAFPAQPRRP